MTYRKLEVLAGEIRGTLGEPPDTPLPGGVALFERLDEFEVKLGPTRIPLQYSTFRPGTENAGRTWFDPNETVINIALDEDTYRGLLRDDGRSRFTLAHELIHAFGHTREVVRAAFEPSQFARDRKHKLFFDTEWQADAGAGALLMPARGLARLADAGRLRVAEVARTFDTSMQAADFRIQKFKEKGLR